MAWLEQRGDQFHLAFRFEGRKFKKSLGTSRQDEAEEVAAKVRRRIQLVEQGDLTIPEDADLLNFFVSDRKQARQRHIPKGLSLQIAQVQYLETLPGTVEPNTLYTLRIHLRHLVRLLGKHITLKQLVFASLQRYVDARTKETGRYGRPVSPTTVRKELASLSSLWSWAVRMEHVKGAFPGRGLRFPKGSEKPAFQTLAEVERCVAEPGLTKVQKSDLWACVYLTMEELAPLLAHVRTSPQEAWLYPMILTAAHTGARRSELVRSEPTDIDFKMKTLVIRERKRAKGKQTFRRVPLSAALLEVLQAWVATSKAPHTFHQDGEPLLERDATHHLAKVLSGTRWSDLPGWHTFRHSFISNCASKGIDQRMIDAWSGHTTEAMRRRYTHLVPNVQLAALNSVFEG